MLRAPENRGPQHVGLSAVCPFLWLQAIIYPACALVVLHMENQFVFPALHAYLYSPPVPIDHNM